MTHHSYVTGPLVVVGASLLLAAACGSLESTGSSPGCGQQTSYVIGDTVSGSLAVGDCKETDGAFIDLYDVTVSSQSNLVVALSSPGLQAILRMYDYHGAIVVSSEVNGAPDTTATVRVRLAPGGYLLGVRGVVSGASGAYRLTTTPDTSAYVGCGLIWVTPGIQTTQRLTGADCTQGPAGTKFFVHSYLIVLLANQLETFTERSTAFSPFMIVVDPSGGTSSSSPDTVGSASVSTVASSAGVYRLWVSTANQFGVGQYTLIVR